MIKEISLSVATGAAPGGGWIRNQYFVNRGNADIGLRCPSLVRRSAPFRRLNWPAFRDGLRREHPRVTEDGLLKAREFNFQRYHFEGIGRYAADAAYARGLADLQVLAHMIPAIGYVHGPQPTSVDAGIYGFIANIHFYDIDTPLKQFVSSQQNLVRHCAAIHEAVMRA